MNRYNIQRIIGIVMMLYSVYMFFDSRGGLGFFVLLIGAAIFGTAKNKPNNNDNYIPR